MDNVKNDAYYIKKMLKDMRNKILHEYGDVKLDVVYQIVVEDIPDICAKLEGAVTV